MDVAFNNRRVGAAYERQDAPPVEVTRPCSRESGAQEGRYRSNCRGAFSEDLVSRVAHAFQRGTDWRRRLPILIYWPGPRSCRTTPKPSCATGRRMFSAQRAWRRLTEAE